MPLSVIMPALEMAQETGKLISWFKKEGDSVAKGEPLLEIETDKAVVEVESPGEGILSGVKAQVGDEIPVGRTIAWILRPGESIPAEEARVETGRKTTLSIAPSATKKPAAAPQPGSGEIKASPKARRLAAEHGVDLSKLRGTGPGGEILAADILQAAASPAVAGSALHGSPVARLMAQRTTQSWTTVPHFFVTREVDASELVRERERLAPEIERSRGVKLTITDLLVSLVARVLIKNPKLNVTWKDHSIQSNAEANIGVAVAVEDGVVAPVIRGANKIDPGEIAVQRRDLAERARAGKLRPQDITGGTFTITNLGMLGVDAFTAIIMPPQVAILAVGRLADHVVAINGAPAVRPMMTFTLSSDHRVVDGARAAEFLSSLNQAIEKPMSVQG
jgi:pyruvate dehydrogenase E2 component (dihydrolipoamide acetyltransferase)